MTTTLPITPRKPKPSTITDNWVEASLCPQVGPDVFFPATKGTTATQRAQYDTARTICQQCPVKQQCLESAMHVEHGLSHYYRFGMFGGLTPIERSELAGFDRKVRLKQRAGH